MRYGVWHHTQIECPVTGWNIHVDYVVRDDNSIEYEVHNGHLPVRYEGENEDTFLELLSSIFYENCDG